MDALATGVITMRMSFVAIPVLAMLGCLAPTESFAQNRAARGAIIGGASGAIIGGAAGGGRGAAIGAGIGAVTGAIVGDQMQRRGRYYWYNGRCFTRFRNGEFHRVSNRNCR